MSLAAYQGALNAKAPTPAAKVVLFVLANFADETGVCFPCQATICELGGISERTVRDALNALVAVGLLERTVRRDSGGRRTSDTLRLTFMSPAKSAGGQPARSAGGSTGKSRRRNRQESSPQPANPAPELPKELPTDLPSAPSPARPALALVPLDDMLDPVDLAFQAYNDLARECDLPIAMALNDTRRKKIKARLKDGGLTVWRAMLDKIKNTPGLRGANDRKWRADLDFMLQEKSWTKLREGSYDHWKENGHGKRTRADGWQDDRLDDLRSLGNSALEAARQRG